MKLLSIAIIFSFLFFFTKNQKPENVTLYHINCNQDCTYEYKVLKGEIFGFEFSRARGSSCQQELLNRTLLIESYAIQFLTSYIYDYISVKKSKIFRKTKRRRGKKKGRRRKQNEEGTGLIIRNTNKEPNLIVGGSEIYYEVFKALHEANIPQKLKFIYTCSSDYIYRNVSVNIWVCDEILDNKCINKKKCSEIESPSKENCENFITSNEESKCIFDEKNNKCIEKNICSLVVNEPEINCEEAATINIKTKCVYDEEQKKCNKKIEHVLKLLLKKQIMKYAVLFHQKIYAYMIKI